MNNDIIELLSQGDKRTVGSVDRVLKILETQPGLVKVVLECLSSADEVLAMHAADCLEKYSRTQPENLQGHVSKLMKLMQVKPQQELRWHLAQILPRLELSSSDMETAILVWGNDFYNSKSSIVRTASLQAMADIVTKYPLAQSRFNDMLGFALEQGTAAMKARAKHLATRT